MIEKKKHTHTRNKTIRCKIIECATMPPRAQWHSPVVPCTTRQCTPQGTRQSRGVRIYATGLTHTVCTSKPLRRATRQSLKLNFPRFWVAHFDCATTPDTGEAATAISSPCSTLGRVSSIICYYG